MKSKVYQAFRMAPFVRSRVTTADLMYLVVLSLLPCAGMGIYQYGYHAALLIGTAVAAAIVCELACGLIWRSRTSSVLDYSCVVTGLICGLLLPPAAPLWTAAAMSGLAIVVFKNLFGGLGHNLLNPAMAAKCVLLLTCRSMMLDVTSWNYTDLPPLELLQSGETPELMNMLTGSVAGYIGTASALAVLFTALLLFLTGLIDLTIPAAAILSFSVAYVLIGRYGLSPYTLAIQLCGGSFLFTCFVMAEDYTTSPISKAARIWYGLIFGAGVFVLRHMGFYEDAVVYALLAVNLLRPILDHKLAPKPFGYSAHKWVIRELRRKREENPAPAIRKPAAAAAAAAGSSDGKEPEDLTKQLEEQPERLSGEQPDQNKKETPKESRRESRKAVGKENKKTVFGGKRKGVSKEAEKENNKENAKEIEKDAQQERTIEQMDEEFRKFQEIIEKEARGLETARYTGDDTLLREAYAEAAAQKDSK